MVQSILVPEFRRHGKHPSRTETARERRPAYFDPWWWPLDPANEPADWSLLEHQRDEFLSLCDVKVNGNKWAGPSFDNLYGNVIRFLR